MGDGRRESNPGPGLYSSSRPVGARAAQKAMSTGRVDQKATRSGSKSRFMALELASVRSMYSAFSACFTSCHDESRVGRLYGEENGNN